MGRIVIKKTKPQPTNKILYNGGRQSTMARVYEEPKEEVMVKEKIENNENNNDIVMMDTNQKIELANAVLAEEGKIKAKRIRKEKGLIERKENTIVLTEDNRELLKG